MRPSWSPLLATVHLGRWSVQECVQRWHRAVGSNRYPSVAYPSPSLHGSRAQLLNTQGKKGDDPSGQDRGTTAQLQAELLLCAHLGGQLC